MSNITQNSTDATMGQSLRARVETRKQELETALGELPEGNHTRQDIEAALSQVSGLMTGDLDNIPQVVAADMSRWLEASKHLDEHPAKAEPPTEDQPPPALVRMPS